METKHIRILDDVLNYLYDNRTCEKGKQITHTIISLTKVFTELDISDIENILQKSLDLYKTGVVKLKE